MSCVGDSFAEISKVFRFHQVVRVLGEISLVCVLDALQDLHSISA
jgi:hypothetical protein